jgi:ribose-phosphate pyrophosphokinase
MLNLNLAHEEESEIGYKKSLYPDRQVSIELDTVELANYGDGPVTIRTRFNSYDDMMYLLAATDVLHHTHSGGAREIHIYIPCMLGQRSDRRFKEGQSFDLGIIADIIKGQGYASITFMHSHSDVMPALFERDMKVVPLTNAKLISFMMRQLKGTDVVFVSPDAGAYKKVYDIAGTLKVPTVAANKVRKDDGPHVEVSGDVAGKVCVIIDDYCDGGGTYVNGKGTALAEKLKAMGAAKVILCITHFLGSRGVAPLLTAIDQIFTTNSIQNLDHEAVEQLKVI